MQLGFEIIHEQLFFRRELRERVYWFVRLRWVAAAAGLLGLAAGRALNLPLPYAVLLIAVAAIALYNGLFFVIGRKLEKTETTQVRDYELFAYAQVFLDLIALYAVIGFTGGLSSPLLLFVIFHVILSGILLSRWSCFVCTILIVVIAWAMLLMHLYGLVSPSLSELPVPHIFSGNHFLGVIILLISFSACLLITAYLTSTIKLSLQYKGRKLMYVSRELEVSNAKLTSLYDMVKEMDVHRRLDEMLNSAVNHVTKIMGVKAGSIKMLEPDRRSLRFRAACGLSGDYLNKGAISVRESEINRVILEGGLYAIGDAQEAEKYQYPEDIRREGIASMLCLPLKVEEKVLGVLCVYSRQPNRFTKEDADFFSLMSELTALSIERLNRDAARTWFLGKAAHQLRAPLNAVQSMLGVLTGGYQGEMLPDQVETLTRCRKRLDMLQATINDLLLLAMDYREIGSPALAKTNPMAILKKILPAFEAQAQEKGLEIEVDIDGEDSFVLAQEKMLDDLFSNLISNAVKYTDPGGKIWIELSASADGHILFEVSDTGIGIEDQDRELLFHEFFRGRKAREMTEVGTGLGMVIVKETLDLLAGSVSIQSSPGKGTRVVCRLPEAG